MQKREAFPRRPGARGLLAALLALAVALPVWAGEIHEAIVAGDEARVVQLLRAHPELASEADANDDYRSLPLHHAATHGHLAIAKALLAAGAEVDAGDSDNSRPLDVAAMSGQIEMVKLLLARGADINQQDKNGSSPLTFAMTRGELEVVELLIDRGGDLEKVDRNGINGLFHRVAEVGHLALVEMLLKRGADVHYANDLGGTALHRAAQRGRAEMVAYLLKQGADVNAPDSRGRTALIRAAWHNQPDGIPSLIAHGARVDQHTWKEKQTALHYASLNGRADVAKALLAGGASAQVRDHAGRRPIDLAALLGHQALVKLFTPYVKGPAPALAGPALAEHPVTRDGEATILYLNHSGYAVKTSRHLLIFDYWGDPAWLPDEPNLHNGRIRPEEIAGEKVVVFASHEHADHYDPVILEWREQVPNITYVLGCQPEGATDYIYMAGRQARQIGDLHVRTIESNDSGVGFVVAVDGVTLFHAGDHANRLRDFSGTYQPEIDYLVANNIRPDIAFMPISGCRFRDQVAVKLGVHYALETLKPKMFFPAHAGAAEFRYAEFAEDCRGRFPDTRICAPECDGDPFVFCTGRAELTMTGSCQRTCSASAY